MADPNKKKYNVSNQQKDQFEIWAKENAQKSAVPIVRQMQQARPIKDVAQFRIYAHLLLDHSCPFSLEVSINQFPSKLEELRKDIDSTADHISCNTVYFLNQHFKHVPLHAFGSMDHWMAAKSVIGPLIDMLKTIHVKGVNKIIEQMYEEQPHMKKGSVIKPGTGRS